MPEREISDIERALQARHNPSNVKQFTSTSSDMEQSEYLKDLALPVEQRGRVPLTQERYIMHENPMRVEWERQTRLFLKQLNTRNHGHRVTAPMVFEWTTGISIAELAAAEGADQKEYHGGGQNGSANVHLRHINWVLKEYFGTPYKTKIAGREVGRAYRVKQHFRVTDYKPVCLTLWPEWENRTLEA